MYNLKANDTEGNSEDRKEN